MVPTLTNIISVEVETKEAILNEDYNNKQKERVRRDFKDKIHHHGIKKEEAREQLNYGHTFVIIMLGIDNHCNENKIAI